MRRVIVICEGETEQEFCKKTLSEHFSQKGIEIVAPLIKKSNGGIVSWNKLKKQIETTLSSDRDSIVSLLIDYYGLRSELGFPQWKEAEKIADKNNRMSFLEAQMKADVNEKLRYRFIPYVQLHEFEALLFCNADVYKQVIPEPDLVGWQELEQTILINPNPEMINSKKETSPSHRLERIIRGYNKVVYGNIIAESIGLDAIKKKCSRFSNWIESLENSGKVNL